MNQLNVSAETMASIKQFLLKTSVPRMVEERKKNKEAVSQ